MTAVANSFAGVSDESLAQRAQAGSAACFEELVRRYQAPLLQFLTQRFGRWRDAEDVLQEAFLRAYEALGRYEPRLPFRAWLYTIAYRLAVSQARKKQARRLGAVGHEAADGLAGPPAAVEHAERTEQLWAIARAVLAEEPFTALWLFYAEDMPAVEIARVLGRSWVSVKTMMHRARRQLHDELQRRGLAP